MTTSGGAKARELLLTVDRWFGGTVSQLVCDHHHRRLRRVGWECALDPPPGGWAAGEPPPRPGNAVELLIDGAHALPAIADELQQARSHVHLTGWYFTPGFALRRDGEPAILRNLLAELAERVDVRVLAWAGAPLPLFRPSRRDVREMRAELTRNTRIQCRLDAKERPLHCHHEKTIVIDDRIAFVGGIDLTSEAGDRYDTNEHPSRAQRRLARRLRADRRAGRRRCRSALPDALARSDGGATCTGRAESAGRTDRASDRADGSREDLCGASARGLSDPRVLHPGPQRSETVHLHREPVPLVARDREDPDRPADDPAEPRLPAGAGPAGKGEQRRRRHARRSCAS